MFNSLAVNELIHSVRAKGTAPAELYALLKAKLRAFDGGEEFGPLKFGLLSEYEDTLKFIFSHALQLGINGPKSRETGRIVSTVFTEEVERKNLSGRPNLISAVRGFSNSYFALQLPEGTLSSKYYTDLLTLAISRRLIGDVDKRDLEYFRLFSPELIAFITL